MATLTQEWVCFILFRFIMPSIFLVSTIFRVNFFSLVYGFLMLSNALLSRPTHLSIKRGLTGKFLLLAVVLTTATLISQSFFQIYVAVSDNKQLQQQQKQISEQQEVLEGYQKLPNFLDITAKHLKVIENTLRKPFEDGDNKNDDREDNNDNNYNDSNKNDNGYDNNDNKSNDSINKNNDNNKSSNVNLNESSNHSFPEIYKVYSQNCSSMDLWLMHIGLQRIDNTDALNVIRILCPDIASFLISVITLACCQAWFKPTSIRLCCSRSLDQHICKCSNLLSIYIGNLTTVVLIATAGILLPSLLNLVYFLVVISSMTTWSLVLRHRLAWFQRIRFFTVAYAGLHLLIIYLRQIPMIANKWDAYIPEGSLMDRLLGLPKFVETYAEDCDLPQALYLRTNYLTPLAYIHLVVLILLYFILAAEIRRWMLKMKFFSIRSILNANSIHQNILLKNTEGRQNNDSNSISNHCSSDYLAAQGFETTTQGYHSNLDSHKHHTVTTLNSFYTIKDYALKQSYIACLIVMMVWSITYHSWLTFVLLLAACIIWVMPLKRIMCLRFSPIILFYALCLNMLQYIYGLNLNNDELPSAFDNGFDLKDIGLVKYDYPAGPLAIKLVFTCVFWLTVRHMIERRSGWPRQDPEILLEPLGSNNRRSFNLAVNSRESEMIKNVGMWIWQTMCKYWIFVCAALFLFISLQEAVVFRLVYMILFLYFVITFQVSYKFWRKSIKVFLWVVILYSIIVLVGIYTYQFKGFPDHWQSVTSMDRKMLINLGLKKIDTTELFIDLLTPTSFLIIVSIQLHYFQNDFLKMSDLNRFKSMDTVVPETRQASESTNYPNRRERKDRFLVLCSYLWTKINSFLEQTSEVLWRFVEIHIFKVTVSTIFICCVIEVSALNTLLVLVAICLLPFPRLHSSMLISEMILSSAILLFKMIYQMDIIEDDLMSSNCNKSSLPENSTDSTLPPFRHTLNNTHFIGIHKEKNMAKYLMIYIIMILMLSLESIVRYHQIQHYRHPHHQRPMNTIVFSNIRRVHADLGLSQCFKFFANYFFYKFGKELCFIVSMTTMVVRLDLYSVVYGLLLGMLLLLNRRQCAFVWPFYITLLVFLLVVQYLSCVGVPPALCWVYPWTRSDFMHRNLQIFLYLPDYQNRPWPLKLIGDYFQLLFACLQWNVFHMEATKLEEFGGGDNESIVDRLHRKVKNPQNDFLSYKDSYLDYIKTVVFFYSFWVSLMVVFISGMSRISLFCMGYLIGCFVFLWFGEGMLLKPLKKLTNMWMGMLMYCYLVLMAKCVLQLIGCVYISALDENYCLIIQLFNIVCLRSGIYIPDEQQTRLLRDESSGCKMSKVEAGLYWDALCFVFLLFMLRIYKTWYFQHVVNELHINNKLAARGAELINNKLIDDINMMKANEERALHNFRTKMNRIRIKHWACMQEIHKGNEQADDHYLVIRSGDYYMFPDVDEEDKEMLDGDTVSEEEEQMNKENEDWRDKKSSVAPSTLLAAAFFGGGPKEALSMIGRGGNFSRSMSISSNKEYTTPEAEMSPSLMMDGTSSTIVCDAEEVRPSSMHEESTPVSAVSLSASLSLLSIQQPQNTYSPILHSPTPYPPNPNQFTVHTPAIYSPTTYTPTLHNTPAPYIPTPAIPIPIPSTSSTSSTHPKTIHKHGEIMPSLTEVALEMDIESSLNGSKSTVVAKPDNDHEEDEEEEDVLDETTKKVETGLRMCKVVTIGLIDILIEKINNSTRHYRSVSLKLHEEKERQKLLYRDSVLRHNRQNSEDIEEDITDGTVVLKDDEILKRKRKENEFHNTMPRINVLIIAISEALVARTDLLCYFVMILNTILSASILSIVYPLSVFFWAMLSVPRPTKFYWVAAITYTEAIIVFKYIFQFNFYPWNKPSHQIAEKELNIPQLIGIEKKDMYAALDFFVLFFLFIHRTMLKKRGLWTQNHKVTRSRDATFSESLKTPAEMMDQSNQGDGDSNNITSNNDNGNNHNNNLNKNNSNSYKVTRNNSKSKKSSHKNNNTYTSILVDKLDEDIVDDAAQEMVCKKKSLCSRMWSPIRNFYKHIINPKYSAMNDVFAPMFACDLFTFLIVVFGYNNFGPSEQLEESDVASVIQQSRVPVPFLLMLLVQFLLIIIDRALYLRKLVFGKFIFHIVLVLLVHIWTFFLLPFITDIAIVNNPAAQLWYFTKCIYFGFSCYQVRSGYPIRICGNFLTKKFGYFNLFCFKGFLAIPFLRELRALTDWMWTDTTFALTSWLQMEDIYANVFVLKCWRKIERDNPTPRAIPRPALLKYGLGGSLLFTLLFIVWFPLIIFSMSSRIYEPNPPTMVEFKISIEGQMSSQPIFSIVSQKNQLEMISKKQYNKIKKIYSDQPKSRAFLHAHRENDVYKVHVGGISIKTWEISHPVEQALIRDLTIMNKMTFSIDIVIHREPLTNGDSTNPVHVHFARLLNSSIAEDKLVLKAMADMINGSDAVNSVTITRMFPRYLTIPAKRKANETGVLFYPHSIASHGKTSTKDNVSEWSTLRLSLHKKKDDKSRWWQMQEQCSNMMKEHDEEFCENDEGSMLVTFSERVPTGVLTLVNKYGVIGLYFSVILVIGRFVRVWSVGSIHWIPITNIPFVERLYNLCLDIYLVRQAREYAFEELLFAKLNFLFRSNETMIGWTRHPKPKPKSE